MLQVEIYYFSSQQYIQKKYLKHFKKLLTRIQYMRTISVR